MFVGGMVFGMSLSLGIGMDDIITTCTSYLSNFRTKQRKSPLAGSASRVPCTPVLLRSKIRHRQNKWMKAKGTFKI